MKQGGHVWSWSGTTFQSFQANFLRKQWTCSHVSQNLGSACISSEMSPTCVAGLIGMHCGDLAAVMHHRVFFFLGEILDMRAVDLPPVISHILKPYIETTNQINTHNISGDESGWILGCQSRWWLWNHQVWRIFSEALWLVAALVWRQRPWTQPRLASCWRPLGHQVHSKMLELAQQECEAEGDDTVNPIRNMFLHGFPLWFSKAQFRRAVSTAFSDGVPGRPKGSPRAVANAGSHEQGLEWWMEGWLVAGIISKWSTFSSLFFGLYIYIHNIHIYIYISTYTIHIHV